MALTVRNKIGWGILLLLFITLFVLTYQVVGWVLLFILGFSVLYITGLKLVHDD